MITDPSAFRGNPPDWGSEEEESKVEPEEKTPEMIAKERKEKIQIWFWGSLLFIAALFLLWAVYFHK